MSRKHVLLLAILLSILIGSLLYIIVPEILHPLRIDRISSDAYVVPWMQPSLSIKSLDPFSSLSRWKDTLWDLDMIMPTALKLNMTFGITIPNGTRVIPSTIYLGHDTDYLYVGGKFSGMYTNPTAGIGEGSNQYFAVYFDADNDGKLTFPESGSRFYVSFIGESLHPSAAWACEDMIWTYDQQNGQHEVWLPAEDYYSPQAQPQSATTSNVWEYDNSTGTLTVLFSRYLLGSGDPHTNAFIMKNGERWVMGFNLELGYSPENAGTEFLTDGWPQQTYPYVSNDASWWPKLAIDLTNTPSWLAS